MSSIYTILGGDYEGNFVLKSKDKDDGLHLRPSAGELFIEGRITSSPADGPLECFNHITYNMGYHDVEHIHEPGKCLKMLGRDKDWHVTKDGSFSCNIPLSDIFGFCRDYDGTIYGYNHRFVFNRNKDNKITLTNVYIKIAHGKPCNDKAVDSITPITFDVVEYKSKEDEKIHGKDIYWSIHTSNIDEAKYVLLHVKPIGEYDNAQIAHVSSNGCTALQNFPINCNEIIKFDVREDNTMPTFNIILADDGPTMAHVQSVLVKKRTIWLATTLSSGKKAIYHLSNSREMVETDRQKLKKW